MSSWRALVTRVPGIELREGGGRDTFKHLLGEDTEQLPADVQGFENCAILVVTLRDEVLLELGEELEVQQVVGRERLLTDDGLHRLHVLADGVASVQLVGNVGVVLTGHALADGGLHQTGERWQHVHWRVDLSVV